MLRQRYLIAAIATLLLLGVALISACTQGNAEPGKTADGRIVVEFWHAMGKSQGEELMDIIDQFNHSQDTYRVEGIYQGNYNSLSQKLIASLYAKRNPAASQAYPGWSTRFYRYDFLTPVQDFIDNDPEFAKVLPDYWPVMIAENSMKNLKTGQSEIVTLPFNKSVYVLYVNQTLMEELGWDEPPHTWDEFMQLAEEMTVLPEGADKPERYGFATRPYIEDFTVQLMSAGSQLMNEETSEALLTSPLSIEAMEFLRDLVGGTNEGGARVGYVETAYLNSVFGSERIGMYIGSTASFTYNDRAVGNKFIWRAYEIPSRNESTEGHTLMQGTNIAIYNNQPEEVQQGAWEFLKFLTSPEITAQWAQATGYMPVRQSALDVPLLSEHLERDISFANAIATLPHATFEPRVLYWESVRSNVSRTVESILQSSDLDIKKALIDLEEEIKSIQASAE